MGRIQIQNYDRKQILNEQECLNRYDELVKEIEPIIAEVNINDPDGFDKWEEVNKQIQEKEKELNPCREKGFLSIYLYGDEDIQVFNKKCTENPECPSSPLNPQNIPAPLKSKSVGPCEEGDRCNEGELKTTAHEVKAESRDGALTSNAVKLEGQDSGKNQNKNKYLHRPKWGQILTGAMLDLIIKHLMQWLVNLLINLERERINHKFNPPQLLPKMIVVMLMSNIIPTQLVLKQQIMVKEIAVVLLVVKMLVMKHLLVKLLVVKSNQTPQREYIMMGLAPVALILLLTFLFKYTPMKMLFRQKKSKNKKIGQKKCKGY
ncbi:variable surface protein Vir18 [Plasmodium vivax Mauritania I]|uniref:Variable surface protein Vir18 n=1 Tax=Plasmodium vivax Mauritania I TaxID=1035515 RepID=A0A0J9TMG2_PLAVI|nr:variable surface protein Vir18 [Plasmodium vivax Mauritania I]